MVAIYIDSEKYLKSHSFTHQTPGCILVDSIPDENDPEKLSCYKYIDNEFVFDAEKWATIQAKRFKEESERVANKIISEIQGKINKLKTDLESSDYKIIKCFEYSLLKLELPYDLETLHSERQAMRNKINELELKL